ncbi:MAG: asparagine synthetase B family protein, partial [Alteraurantiacibacter sp. bin_em_oilr2.035]|nr:asparagine synthetase B family protein [Alteraurantiacibacter sp. bin_em_oilr2.035]
SERWYSIDETVWREVKRLPPAHNLQLAGGQLSIKRYWSLPTEVTLNYRSDGEYFEHYREVFADCVKRASRTHSPLAVEVSGGLDSSAIFVMANALMKRGELGAHELRGYTLRGPEESPADEQRFVDAVARTTGRHISSFPLARPPLSWFNEQARQYRDIPTYPNGAMSLEMDQQLVADGCMVKLTGVGGDQWLDGSRRYYGEALRGGDAAGFMTSLRADLRDLGKSRTAELVARGFLRPLVPARLRAKLRQHTSDPHAENLDESWLSPEMRAELDRRSKARDDSLPRHDRDRHKVQKLTFPFLPLALDLIERQSASLGFETRHPMLSRKFIEFSATTPERMRLRGSVGKYIHRRALVGILPREIAERNCKAEFSTTFDGNLEGIHALLVEAQNTGFECLVERDKIDKLMEAWGELSIDETPIWKLWGIYVIAALYLHSKMA